MSLLDETIYAIRRAKSQPGFNPTRWQYVVNKQEWAELDEQMYYLQPITQDPPKPRIPSVRLQILGVQIVVSS